MKLDFTTTQRTVSGHKHLMLLGNLHIDNLHIELNKPINRYCQHSLSNAGGLQRIEIWGESFYGAHHPVIFCIG